ncbi:reverse transcriptase domain-containing protein [Tanacetum coccineum]
MDIVGPLPEAPSKVKYLIVAVDYFTKWIEAKAVTSITGRQVKNFAFDNIVCRRTRNKTSLYIGISSLSKWSCGKGQSKHNARNQNKTITGRRSMGRRIAKCPPKMSNEETPFSLAYGTEAIIPAEIDIPTRRTIQRSNEENKDALRMNLNLLEERRETATIREARRKQQVERYYNQRVHHKQFKVGEFVLRKNKLSKIENTGKLGPKWEGSYEVTKTCGTSAYKLWSMKGAEIPRT